MRLSDVVTVGRRFQRAVRIDNDLTDPAALEGFVCPRSSVEALLTMGRHVADTGHGAFTWTGPYGTGKSSLVVALSALLAREKIRRKAAAAAIGHDAAEAFWKLLPPGRHGWITLPVVGRRGDAATVINEALATLPGLGASKPKRGPKGSTGALGEAVIDQLRTLAESPDTQGVILVIDEMGKLLEEAATGNGDLYFFQQLAEAASQSSRRIIVIGVLHQAFDEYASRLAREVRDEWAKVHGRFIDIPLNTAGEEQIELLARAIQTTAPVPSVEDIAEIVGAAIRRVRPGVSPEFSSRLRACWPLHPVVACLLGPISRRRFGQNQRSLFGFLNSAEPMAFQEFLRDHSLETKPLYTADRLWDYLRVNLEPAILASPDGHRWSLAVEAVERCEASSSDALHVAVAKTIAIIDLFKERSGLVASQEVLGAALVGTTPAAISKILDDLRAWSVVIYKKHLGAYAIYAGSDFDIDAAVTQVRRSTGDLDFSVLRRLARLQPVLAKRLYHETGALHWFEVNLAPLSEAVDRASEFKPKNGAVGLFLLLLPTRGEVDARAKRICRDAAARAVDWPVVVGLSRNAWLIRELAAELVALEHVRTERTELEGDAVARREIAARIVSTSAALEDELRQSLISASWHIRDEIHHADGLADLSAIASKEAARVYKQSPCVRNELLNRIRPSSNAVAAQKALLKCMVEHNGKARLGIDGYPAEGGLFASLLEETCLYRPRESGSGFHFADPPDDHPTGLAPLWHAAEDLFLSRTSEAVPLSELYKLWRAPPFGVRDGLLPVLAIAFLLSKADRCAIYLDGVFRPSIDSLLVDRLAQEPASVAVRWMNFSEIGRRILAGLADVVVEIGQDTTKPSILEPLEVARRLVATVHNLNPWVHRTTQLSKTALKLRTLVRTANDPNKFLFDDIPALFAGEDKALETSEVDSIIAPLRAGLRELAQAYPAMLARLRKHMLTELQVEGTEAYPELHARARNVQGVTGDFRLDAFATRLVDFSGSDEDMEGIASLAANKPSRDWIDRDLDQALVELAELAQRFNRAEAFTRVKGRPARRHAMALVVGMPEQPTTLTEQFDVAEGERAKVNAAVTAIEGALAPFGSNRRVVLAALAELSAKLISPEPLVEESLNKRPLSSEIARSARRKGG